MQLQDKIQIELEGDNHVMTSIETPMRADAFDKTDDEKIEIIQKLAIANLLFQWLNISKRSPPDSKR